MKEQLLDIWEELRERRLLPIAVLLCVALIAIPVLLAGGGGGSSAPTVAPVQPPTRSELARLQVQPAENDVRGSRLDSFRARDPFRPPKGVRLQTQGGASGSGSLPTLAGSSGGASQGGSGGGRAGGGAGAGGGAPSGGSTPAPSGGPTTSVRRTTTSYRYVVDLTFGKVGSERRFRGQDKLAMLPSESAPLLILLGVEGDGDNAVFLVDASLKKTSGEGSCKPAKDDCAVLTLGPGNEHRLRDEQGNDYLLRIDAIRRVKVKPASAKSANAQADSAAPARAASAGLSSEGAGADAAPPVEFRRFELPVLSDLFTVVTTETRHSGASKRGE
ncbi:hypothetical protein [Thermoleophilum album]|uniref:Uncharacterized protein n=1 Tax=Thermoleophilum album TaxID=29539 RepID=A0A1H6FWG3_THEAL|nr:hypothetical protein [Thermoleophilum album]SEH14134.1 hypothetical protein SAMN02745716_1523 [Thermoleophilum album]